MHLVFLNQYYPPDVAPTGVMLEGVVQGLVREGHEVTVICAAGGYAGGGGNVEHRTSNVERRTSNVGHRTSDIEHQRGDVQEPEATADSPPIQNSKSKIQNPSPHIIRIGATRFGRGSFAGKLMDYLSYYIGVAWVLGTMRRKPDRIVALTTPPYLSVLARAFSRLRGADHAHWVMDLYPDVMAAHGMLGETSASYRFLAGLTRWGFNGKRRAAVLTLGPDMAERVGRYLGTSNIERRTSDVEHRTSDVEHRTSDVGGMAMEGEGQGVSNPQASSPGSRLPSIQWVPLWGTSNFELRTSNLERRREEREERSGADARLQVSAVALRRQRGWADEDLVVMYSGNMGLGHRFGEILAAARELAELSERDQDGRSRAGGRISPEKDGGGRVRFVFYGGGRRRSEVLEFANGSPGCAVEVHDYAPAEILAAHLRSADVHLASLDPEWTGTMVPSKLQGVFMAGRPVVFIGSAASSIGRWVRESGGGRVVGPGDVAGLLAALAELGDAEIRGACGRAAQAYGAVHFDEATNVARAAAILCGGRCHPAAPGDG